MFQQTARRAAPAPGAECARWPYCGAPYFLPVRALVPRAHRLPAPPLAPPGAPPAVRLEFDLAAVALNASAHEIHLNLTGESPRPYPPFDVWVVRSDFHV